LVHTNSDRSAKREKVCHLRGFVYVRREGAKHQICHTLPERTVGTSLWCPKIFYSSRISPVLLEPKTETGRYDFEVRFHGGSLNHTKKNALETERKKEVEEPLVRYATSESTAHAHIKKRSRNILYHITSESTAHAHINNLFHRTTSSTQGGSELQTTTS